jgi:hypothetical protein
MGNEIMASPQSRNNGSSKSDMEMPGSIGWIDKRNLDVRINSMADKIDELAEAVGLIGEALESHEEKYGGMLDEMKNDREFWRTTIDDAKRKIVLMVILGVCSATLLGGGIILKGYLEGIVAAPVVNKK